MQPTPCFCVAHKRRIVFIFLKTGWKNIKRGLEPHDMGELYEIQILSPINSFTETSPCLFNSPSLPACLAPSLQFCLLRPSCHMTQVGPDLETFCLTHLRNVECRDCRRARRAQLQSCVCDGCVLTAMTALSIWNGEREA